MVVPVSAGPYPAYRDSGVEWLGEVPEHWEVRPFRRILRESLKYGANEAAELDDPNLPRFIRITDIDDTGHLRDETFRSLPVAIAEPYLLESGDLLFARSGSVGRTFLYDDSWGTCAYAGYLIRARVDLAKVISKFISYFSASHSYMNWLRTVAIQATIENVSAERYARMPIPLPPLDEQRTIAAFLDREAERIDALVAKKRLLIERLEEYRTALITRTVTRGLPPEAARAAGLDPAPRLKPSGMEWLGDVPEHWEVRRLANVIQCLDGRRVPLNAEERSERQGDFPYWGANGVLDYLDDWLFDEPLVLLGEDGAPFFAPNKRVAFSVSGRIWVNNHAHVLRPDGIHQEFLMHLLNITEYAAFIDGSTRDKLTQGDMNGIPVLLPPTEEQAEIARYLRAEVADLDLVAYRVERAIERLQEYRTALITAAVTGKIDVRESAEGPASIVAEG